MSEGGATHVRPLALVTGGWRRIGAAIAMKLADEGWDLALHAHHDTSFEPDLATALAARGAAVHPLAADLGDTAAAARLVAEAAERAGRPATLLVNCASMFRDDDVHTVSGESLEDHFRVNLFAPVLMTRAFAEALGGAAGAVVMILDQRVVNPVPDQLGYTLSKQALHASVRTLARALAPRIRVNGVAPGLTLPTVDYAADQWQRLEKLMPLHRLAAPEEIAAAVHYLAAAPSVTGQTIFVDAGASLESYARDFVYLAK
ncbi:SDR family oxidoreductase [Novosphingobium sp. KCTC 2891]|uniref:SDR family oxidoreductase n=1 Tax=Novosphingobium sp. KCTC 2891 TaxID=2989730 RepID=UPI002222DFFA|nr:SDR family oxidoreductase [Novosphingobium sp. KCTC 2891]MCW1382578.1 SDR family oxidoreductase [Novosphingobium sp. KCTC 2891]